MNTTTKIKIPKRGWQQELAKMAGCTAQTVINALHHGATGKKAEKVRQLYKIKYGNQ
jgi:hypothetical protein